MIWFRIFIFDSNRQLILETSDPIKQNSLYYIFRYIDATTGDVARHRRDIDIKLRTVRDLNPRPTRLECHSRITEPPRYYQLKFDILLSGPEWQCVRMRRGAGAGVVTSCQYIVYFRFWTTIIWVYWINTIDFKMMCVCVCMCFLRVHKNVKILL